MVSSRLAGLCFGANDPEALARTWAGVLRRDVSPHDGSFLPATGRDIAIRFVHVPDLKTRPNQMHFDITSSSLEDQEGTVARVLELGGTHLDIGQSPDEDHVVLADPEGNEMCIIGPGNRFLADTARIGALSSDGSQAVGYFWSGALGWPLVWDQDGETAIQSPAGGSKISWGGPPVAEKIGPNRLHLDLVADGDLAAEIDRLVGLGASVLDGHSHHPGAVLLADPDGNELYVLPAEGHPA
jgi:predicted enzyme related to lactoylglutathione lyase